MKPKRLAAHRIERWSREIAGNASAIEALAPQLSKVNDWIDTGTTGADYTALRRGGNDSTPVERAALTDRTDGIAITANQALERLEEARKTIYQARQLCDKLIADWGNIDRRNAAEGTARRSNAPGMSSDGCANCGRVVAGTPTDRLRAGRCQSCFRYRDRHAGHERPRELWDMGQCPAIKRTGETDYECMSPAGHPQDGEDDHRWVALEEGVA